MPRKIPPLNPLRAFEVSARHMSFTKAAEELFVTSSANSHQVKSLEENLGIALFVRDSKTLTLTPAGKAYLPGVQEAFRQLEVATYQLHREKSTSLLKINLPPTFAVKWLIPRLADFNRLHPQVRVHLVELAPHAVSRRGADLLLRLLHTRRIEALGAVAVIPNAVGPVIAPALVKEDARSDALTAPRLVPRTHLSAWRDWADLTGRRPPDAPERAVAHLHFALDGALAGWGAAVLPWALTAEAVADGRLLAPFGFARDDGAVAAIPGAGEMSQGRRLFLRWLTDQGRAMPAAPDAT